MARKKTTKKKVTKKTAVKKAAPKKQEQKIPQLPDNFVELEGGLLIPQQEGPDPATASIEELETPDQLEERTSQVDKKPVAPSPAKKVEAETEAEEIKPEEMFPVVTKLRDKHPKWEPNTKKQIDFFNDLIKLNLAETEQVRARMDELEILCDLYPLIASNEDLNEFRKLMIRNVELEGERQFISQHIAVRVNELKAQEAAKQQLLNPEPEKKGFFKRLFS